MVGSAAERIVLDGEVLAQQIRMLGEVSVSLEAESGPAQASISPTAFGAMNSFLVPSMNRWASRTAEIIEVASQLSTRMQAGVKDAHDKFEQLETEYSELFGKAEQ